MKNIIIQHLEIVSPINKNTNLSGGTRKNKPKFSLYNTIKDGALNYATSGLYGKAKSILTSHDVDQIKDQNIFI